MSAQIRFVRFNFYGLRLRRILHRATRTDQAKSGNQV